MATFEDLRRLVFGGDLSPQELELQGRNQFIEASSRFREQRRGIEGVANQAGLSEAVTESQERAGTSFDVAEGVLERRQRGLGLQLTERQRTAQKRRLGLGRAVAEAGAGSAVRRDFSRRSLVASRVAGGIQDSLLDIEAQASIGLANAAGQEKVRRERERAEKKAAKAGLLSTLFSAGVAIASSSEELKHDKRPVIQTEGSLLERLKKVRVDKWKFRGTDVDHIGPYAEEFNETFNVGKGHKKFINLVDAVGVLMGSVKELDAKVEAHG